MNENWGGGGRLKALNLSSTETILDFMEVIFVNVDKITFLNFFLNH